MSPELYALAAAFSFAASHVTTKLGLVSTSVLGGILVSMLTSWLVLALGVILVKPPAIIDATGVLLFIVAGLITPGISRWANTLAIQRLGPSLAAPITQGTRPLLAVTGAVVLLGEALTPTRVVGTLAIIAGGWKLSTIRKDAPRGVTGKGTRPWKLRPGLFMPVIAGFAFASSDVVVKVALGHMSEPLFGAMIGMAAAMLVWGVGSLSFRSGRRQIDLSSDAWWMAISGVCQGVALLALFTALQDGDVSLISPILATQPLAVFVLSRLLLRHLEGLHPATVFAGCSVVAGTIVVSL